MFMKLRRDFRNDGFYQRSCTVLAQLAHITLAAGALLRVMGRRAAESGSLYHLEIGEEVRLLHSLKHILKCERVL